MPRITDLPALSAPAPTDAIPVEQSHNTYQMTREQALTFDSYSNSTRPAAGTAGRVIFNTDDGQLNIDDGTNWILPDGTIT